MIESVLPHNLIVLTVASVVLAGIVQGALMVRRAFTNQRLLQERIAELQAVVDDVHERYNKTLGQLAETTRLAREREERDKRRIGELEALVQELRGRIEELERRLPGDGQRLAVLGIWPDVAKLPPLNAAGEAAAIYNAGFNYRALQDKEATRLNILRELRRHAYGVIEVGAHGNADGIMLSDGLAEPRWWADVLHGPDFRGAKSGGVRLVVLMACESDLVGDALVRAGMPAVVSVQRKIPDRDAVLFVTALYEGLADGATVEEAVARARLAVPRASGEMIRSRSRE